MKSLVLKLRIYIVLSTVSILTLAAFLGISPTSAYASSSAVPVGVVHTVTVGLVIVNPKTHKPLYANPDGTVSKNGTCGTITLKANPGPTGSRLIGISIAANSSQGWITGGSWQITARNAGTNSQSIGFLSSPNYFYGYSQAARSYPSGTVFGVNLDYMYVDTFLAGECAANLPFTTTSASG